MIIPPFSLLKNVQKLGLDESTFNCSVYPWKNQLCSSNCLVSQHVDCGRWFVILSIQMPMSNSHVANNAGGGASNWYITNCNKPRFAITTNRNKTCQNWPFQATAHSVRAQSHLSESLKLLPNNLCNRKRTSPPGSVSPRNETLLNFDLPEVSALVK